ncbi:MAG: hypothetical protein JWQ49_5272 [Edaphobacter sp.]|nr:hypothetical protein [Edaphobacter sp.]
MLEEAGKSTHQNSVSKKARPLMSLDEAGAIAAKKGSGELMDHLLFEAYPRKGKRYPKLTYEDWLTLVGDQWNRCDRGISLFKSELQKALPHRGPVRHMMTGDENAAYDALPEVVTIYRGCDAASASLPGICWSLNKDVANLYPFLGRFRAKKPTVLTACVPKHWILAVKLERQEEEIITFAADVKMIRPADGDRADVYQAARTARAKKLEENHA